MSWNRYLGRQLTAIDVGRRKGGLQSIFASGTFGSACCGFPTTDQRGESNHWSCWGCLSQDLAMFLPSSVNLKSATIPIIDMAKFFGE